METMRHLLDCRYFPIADRERIGNSDWVSRLCGGRLRRPEVLVLDPTALFALAALIGSLSTLVWAVRRKP
jgi:hypothetical protein